MRTYARLGLPGRGKQGLRIEPPDQAKLVLELFGKVPLRQAIQNTVYQLRRLLAAQTDVLEVPAHLCSRPTMPMTDRLGADKRDTARQVCRLVQSQRFHQLTQLGF